MEGHSKIIMPDKIILLLLDHESFVFRGSIFLCSKHLPYDLKLLKYFSQTVSIEILPMSS